MGSLNPPLSELSLNIKPPTFLPKTITQFLHQLDGNNNNNNNLSDKINKIDDFVDMLESEMRKIDAFKRELPLCMLLINDAIVALKEEVMVLRKSAKRQNSGPVLEEFIPIKKRCDEDEGVDLIRKENGDKKNWLSSTQLWNADENSSSVIEKRKTDSLDQIAAKKSFEEVLLYQPYTNPGFIPYKGCGGIAMVDTRQELSVPDLSLITPGIDNSARGGLVLAKSSTDSKLVSTAPNGQSNVRAGVPQCQPPHQQTSRKQRRCWSSELHRRFVNALQQLGGSQAATPKQIRELMQVDGLTNDEVKSHLQKYRLHTRRLPSSNTSSANQSGVGLGGGLWMSPQDQYVESSKQGISQSGSPDGPLLIGTAGGTSTTGDNSMDDGEDTKSENYCWKGHLDV